MQAQLLHEAGDAGADPTGVPGPIDNAVAPGPTGTTRIDRAAEGLTRAQWGQLVRLCRWIERDDPVHRAVLGPKAAPCVQALRAARAAWRRQRRNRAEAGGGLRPPPVQALRAAASAIDHVAQRVRQRPAGFFAPAATAIGHGLLLRMPALKAWLRDGFAAEAAVPAGSPPAAATARARDALLRRCLALCGVEDSFQRRRHLVQLLHDHGHREPLLRLVRRAGRGWLPADWAGSWEAITDIGDDRQAIDALEAALGTLTPALVRWQADLRTTAPAPASATSATPAPAAGPEARRAAPPAAPARTAAAARSAALPIIVRAASLPRRVQWAAGAVVVLALGLGLAAHLTRGNGATDAPWMAYHEADGTTMSIDPASIRREGRQLTYRVGVAWKREGRSAVAVFTTDCLTRQRRIETVQHYRGTRFETATRYEVRGTPAGEWPAIGIDVALLRAACARP
jgi:hypothetical protein